MTDIASDLLDCHFCIGHASNLLASATHPVSLGGLHVCKRLDERCGFARSGAGNHDEVTCAGAAQAIVESPIGAGIGIVDTACHRAGTPRA